MKYTESLDRHTVRPFLLVAIAWIILSASLCIWFASPGEAFGPGLGWTLALCGVCLFDLYALAKTVSAAMGLVSAEGEKRGALTIQAFYWGGVKLACLGILGAILLRGNSIPTLGLMMGSATLIVVPLVGGYWWSQKVLHHAS